MKPAIDMALCDQPPLRIAPNWTNLSRRKIKIPCPIEIKPAFTNVLLVFRWVELDQHNPYSICVILEPVSKRDSTSISSPVRCCASLWSPSACRRRTSRNSPARPATHRCGAPWASASWSSRSSSSSPPCSRTSSSRLSGARKSYAASAGNAEPIPPASYNRSWKEVRINV